MKLIIFFFVLLFLISAAGAQENSYKSQTKSLVTWLVKQENISFLAEDIDCSIHPNSLSILNYSANTLRTLDSFLSKAEIHEYKNTKRDTSKAKWLEYGLDIKYYEEKIKAYDQKVRDYPNREIYHLSLPIFLNPSHTRALIGECLYCGDKCGHGDLILCELKDGKWTLIAKGNVWES